MVTYGTDLVVMGGLSFRSGIQSSFYQFSCENGIFKWEKMKAELKKNSTINVAMTIPDYLLDAQPRSNKRRCCNEKASQQKRSKRRK